MGAGGLGVLEHPQNYSGGGQSPPNIAAERISVRQLTFLQRCARTASHA